MDPLVALGDESKIYIGRKKSIHKEYGEEGTLFLGEIIEEERKGTKVYMDGLAPHVVFICGSRGSGKSYTLGVIVEELVKKNPNVGIVVVDPIGVFWSMKYPNKEKREIELLEQWGLEPEGLKNVKVFIPYGYKNEVPKETYDALFSIRVSELTVDDWCLTFGIERFSPSGLLLDTVLAKLKDRLYDIQEMIDIINNDPDILSRSKGFKGDTRRAIISRLEAAKSWGVLSREGTRLSELSKEGQITVIDISFLEENVAALIIGILARKILDARKKITRRITMGEYSESLDEFLDEEIPPTWLFIDEAHTLIPSGSKTAASDALVEYVKQGRRPGCSLVFATQQPGAIDTKVLSQLDILISHKLTFEEDLKTVFKRMPTLVPKEYENPKFLRTIPIGVALVGDRSENTSRAFLMKIRPRITQHEGREVLVDERTQIKEDDLKKLVLKMLKRRLNTANEVSLVHIETLCDTMRRRYGVMLDSDEIVNQLLSDEELELRDGKILKKSVSEKSKSETKILSQKPTEELPKSVRGIPANETEVFKRLEKIRKKKLFGILGNEEAVLSTEVFLSPVWVIRLEKEIKKNVYEEIELILDDRTRRLIYGRDLSPLISLSERELKQLREGKISDELKKKLRGFLKRGKLDIKPPKKSPKITEIPDSEKTDPEISQVFLKKLFSLMGRVNDISVIYRPIYRFVLQSGKRKRIVEIDPLF